MMISSALNFTEDDPCLVLQTNDAGLQAHNPTSAPGSSQDELVQAILNAGMRAAEHADGRASKKYFYGTASAWIAALNALGAIAWAKHAHNVPDVGELWQVTGPAASLHFMQVLVPFNE
ncbi:hypothetical protein HYH02_003230 [Chlamydomonas schloesseri]|uniref:Uncharacterized protein n=1 Tax=Chlamydomonas schloesseri TaxID=2026947 RepID=A0A836BAM1_9CHLO|nr:hypothetical protein HYH02_003230 [Chlamydomonas schloesseri]|eukprot:KAG2452199.1 hypothetical protein HYH02_003230 [Chlamydomonas schloesseri]